MVALGLGTCFSSVQSLSHVWLFVTPWTAAHQASLSITNSWSLPKLMSIESVIPSYHIIPCRPLLLLSSASGSFPRSQFFTLSGQRIGVSASALLMNIQDWYPLGWTGLISLQSKGLLSPPTPQFKSISSSVLSLLYRPVLVWNAKTICLAIVAMSNCCKAFETLALNFCTSCGQDTIWGLRKRSKNRTRGQGAG